MPIRSSPFPLSSIPENNSMAFQCTVAARSDESHNTIHILLQPDTPFSHSRTCSFVYIHSPAGLRKPYTPLKQDSLEFLVKIYGMDSMSRYIGTLAVGDKVLVSNPHCKIEYIPGSFQSVLMIAGGTGIAPMLQILDTEHRAQGNTRFVLLFCNSTEKDIIGTQELKKHAQRLDVIHIISRPGRESENIVRGRISTDIIREACSQEHRFDFVFVCGKPEMLRDVCGSKAQDKTQGALEGMLHALGYSSAAVYKL